MLGQSSRQRPPGHVGGVPVLPTLKGVPVRFRLLRPYYVLRYYRKRDMAWRLWKIARQRLGLGSSRPAASPDARRADYRARGDVDLSQLVARRCHADRLREARRRVPQIRERRFTFLNEERHLPDPMDWALRDGPAVSHLWAFHLHYHDYLLDLVLADRESAAAPAAPETGAEAWNIVASWLDSNPPGAPHSRHAAWHPFCISKRLVNWTVLWSISPPAEPLRSRVVQSIAEQAEFLSRNLELDLRGNHLLENLRGLVLASTLLEGGAAPAWLELALRLLPEEFDEQILDHGEHFERSPMYHAAMLEVVLDVRDTLAALSDSDSLATHRELHIDLRRTRQRCDDVACRMAGFLRFVLHPDGQIPLLGDSALDETPVPSALIEAAANPAAPEPLAAASASRPHDQRGSCDELVSEPCRATVIGPYWSFRRGADFLLLDAGPLGADHLPAHGHGDLLTIEASVGGRRLLVDGGTFNYQDDAMRRYCRSVAAHNTPIVDGREMCDMWSRFRLGYRGWVRHFSHGSEQDLHWATAAHDAYRSCGARRLSRFVAGNSAGVWICVDWLEHSARRHELLDQLHFHPGAEITPRAEGEFSIRLAESRLMLRLLGAESVTLGREWYCPRFGTRQAAPVIRWRADRTRCTGWLLVAEAMAGDVHAELRRGWQSPVVSLRCARQACEIDLQQLREIAR